MRELLNRYSRSIDMVLIVRKMIMKFMGMVKYGIIRLEFMIQDWVSGSA